MNIYLAARYSRREELCLYRAQLESLGHIVTSRWLNGEHQVTDGQLLGIENAAIIEGDCLSESAIALRQRFAEEDFTDLLNAHCVIAFTEMPRSTVSRGGRHVEMGIALGCGMDVAVVGPRENVFCCLSQVTAFETFDHLIDCWKLLHPKPLSVSVLGDTEN